MRAPLVVDQIAGVLEEDLRERLDYLRARRPSVVLLQDAHGVVERVPFGHAQLSDGSGAGWAAGSVNQKLAPRPGSPSTPMRPPCASTISLQM